LALKHLQRCKRAVLGQTASWSVYDASSCSTDIVTIIIIVSRGSNSSSSNNNSNIGIVNGVRFNFLNLNFRQIVSGFKILY